MCSRLVIYAIGLGIEGFNKQNNYRVIYVDQRQLLPLIEIRNILTSQQLQVFAFPLGKKMYMILQGLRRKMKELFRRLPNKFIVSEFFFFEKKFPLNQINDQQQSLIFMTFLLNIPIFCQTHIISSPNNSTTFSLIIQTLLLFSVAKYNYLLNMDAQGWQNLWARQYNNSSDERWKTKSLNPLPSEQYPIPFPKTVKNVHEIVNKQGKNQKTEKTEHPVSVQDQLLPCPKMNKINHTMFCISMERDVNLFYYITNNEEKAKMKVKKAFGMLAHTLTTVNEKIELVTGNYSNFIFVATKNNLVVLEVIDKGNGTKEAITHKFTKSIPNLVTILALEKRIFALTTTHLYQLDTEDSFKEVSVKKIEFPSVQEQENYKNLKPVGIVTGSNQSIFYFGSRIEEEIDISKLKGAPGEDPSRKAKSQALTIVRLSIVGDNKVDQVKAKVFPIDHIFELGIFTRTKIYQIQKETFLVSLHEEVILIKKNFDRYIVWDNVSVVSSKSQSKKGQLILADKKILVFSENIEIFAHEIYFQEQQSKLHMPPIDNFKGNDNDEQILYDALLLYYEDSIIKVLSYIKPTSVVYPTNDSNFKKRETDPNKIRDEPTHLEFTIICISQSDPKRKLEQLLTQKNTANKEIETFCKRFNISKQDETKSRWNVSYKQLKDIENTLMDIQEDKFIQTELDNILKEKSHNLDFLSSVETKQLARLGRMLVNKIILYSEKQEKTEQDQALLKYIYQILQWYMESEMFLKKVTYSKKFLSFKEYDFIQIGKLKAASLKEEIKLLSSKKFQKRLKYFLNSFKVLVISNYEEVFGFLLQKKSISEISEFLNEFRFILPTFQEPSQVFIRQKDYSIFDKKKPNMLEAQPNNKRTRTLSFAAGANDDQFLQIAEKALMKDKQKEKDKQKMKQTEKFEKQERCQLWDPLQEMQKDKSACKIPETMEYFEEKIIEQLQIASKTEISKQRAIENFRKILQKFKVMGWFENAAFKQHSMITKTTKEVIEQFRELKRKGAFKILIKFLYKKIRDEGPQIEDQVNEMLQQFIKKDIIPQSFKRNVDARVLVYRNLFQKKNGGVDKRLLGVQLPLLEDFIIKPEEKYFNFLFRNIRNKILTDVKMIYENIQPNFFRERFQMFLQSSQIFPDDIIDFVDSFNEDVDADSIRIDVFSAIKRLLRLSDKVNTQNYIHKCMDCEVLPENDDNQTGKLREQAKIPYGFFFYHFFKAFKLDYSFQQFISFTNTTQIKDCKITQELITRYCKGQYELQEDYSGNMICTIRFEQIQGINEKMPNIDIHNQPLQFFGIILHLLDVLDFQIEEREVFELILQNYLNENKFKQLSDFIKKLKEYHLTQYNIQTNNYKMISDFKEEIDVDKQFIDYVINWIERNYGAIEGISDMEVKMGANESALKMLGLFNKNSIEVKKQRSLFQLLSNIRKFDNSLILNVEYIKKEALSNSSFIFLMHRFNQIGVEKFREFSESQQWLQSLNNFSEMFLSHKQYAHQEIVDPSHPDFLRFLIEMCIVMIEENIYPIAKYLITKRIPNDQYYFKDILLLFLTAIKIQENRMNAYRQAVIKHILLPQTTSLIRQNVEDKILNAFRAKQFIQIKEENREIAVIQKKDSKQDHKEQKWSKLDRSQAFIKRSIEMFDMIMSRHRKDDSYFYLIRIKKVQNSSIIKIAEKYRAYSYGDESEKQRQNIEFHAYLLATAYIKAIELFIQKEFYPTYLFFESKMIILQDVRERKDIIKDVNIALSKLDRIKVENQMKKNHLESTKKELLMAYNAYMEAIGENPDIQLTDNDGRGLNSTKKVEVYSRKNNNDLFMQQTIKQVQYKKDLQRNSQKINQVQQDNRINVMQREITEKITQIKKVNERHALLQADLKKKDDHEESLVVRRERQLENIRKNEKQEIESIKDTYKSNTTKRVNDLIENLRKNREKVAAKRNAPTSSIRDQGRESNIYKPPNITINQPPSIRRQDNFTVQSPKSDLLSDHLLPITMKGKVQKIQSARDEVKPSVESSNKILDLQKRMFSDMLTEPTSNQKKKVNFQDIANLYKLKESEQAYKCIQKYDMLKSPHVRTQLVKRAYTVTNNLQNLIEFYKFLLAVDESWKESIQEKSLSIATQMMKMQNKDKISIKEIIPVEFFTTVVKLSIKDYYSHAFQIFKGSIRKIFEKDLMAVHTVGILFRYTLGSENRFYNKVFYEYFKVILKNYEIKNVDDKELTLLAEKIRSNYTSLPDNKDQVLEELLMGISNPLKRSRLLDALKRTLERKGESLVGGSTNKEIAYVLQKMMK